MGWQQYKAVFVNPAGTFQVLVWAETRENAMKAAVIHGKWVAAQMERAP